MSVQFTNEVHTTDEDDAGTATITTKVEYSIPQVDLKDIDCPSHKVAILLKLKQRILIQAKLFVSINMGKVEDAMEAGNIKEQEYITTLDTLMIMDQVIIPHTASVIKLIKWYGTTQQPLSELSSRMFQKYNNFFEEIWVGRCQTKPEGNNLMDIEQIAAMYAYAKMFWNSKDETKKQAPLLLDFKSDDLKMLKSIMPKWIREKQLPIDRMLDGLANK